MRATLRQGASDCTRPCLQTILRVVSRKDSKSAAAALHPSAKGGPTFRRSLGPRSSPKCGAGMRRSRPKLRRVRASESTSPRICAKPGLGIGPQLCAKRGLARCRGAHGQFHCQRCVEEHRQGGPIRDVWCGRQACGIGLDKVGVPLRGGFGPDSKYVLRVRSASRRAKTSMAFNSLAQRSRIILTPLGNRVEDFSLRCPVE